MNTEWEFKNRFKRNLAGILTFCMFMPMMPHGCSTMGAHKRHEEKSQTIGNKVCPVSGQKIDEKTKVTYDYKGKTYNFCCVTCVGDFKKDPQKYIKKTEEEKLVIGNKQEPSVPQQGQHSHH